MSAYGNMDSAIAGLKSGLGGTVETWRAAQVIPFGTACFGYKGDAVNAYGYKKDVSKVVYSADFIASNSTIVTVNGVPNVAVVYGTSHAATMLALKAAILLAVPTAEVVIDPADTNGRTLLIRTRGITSVVSSATTAGSSQPTTTITTASGQVFLGFALFTQKESVGIATYAIGDVMNVFTEDGKIWVPISTAVSANSPALIAADGSVANAGASCGARIRSTSASGLALVEPDGQYDLTYAGSF